MRNKRVFAALFTLLFLVAPCVRATGQNLSIAEPFTGSVLTDGLDSPWDMIWGPDGKIWVTEREGSKVTSIDPVTGEKKLVANLADVHTGPQHEGVLGIALSPTLGKANGDNYVYIGHTYMDGTNEHARIMRFRYDAGSGMLLEPRAILSGLPAGSDHNGGRLRFGPDGKIYYTIGEQGHNQGKHACEPILAQRLPTAAELDKADYTAYAGKVLRLNSDGSVPADNPELEGVRSHIFTYGHRNPQGLVFVGDRLFSSEQGPSTDDEINLLVAGGNYGWPHVAGFQDDQAYVYANWSEAKDCSKLPFDPNITPPGVPQQKETEWHADNFREPLITFHTVPRNYNFNDQRCANAPYMCWPTISPGSVEYYPANGPIPGWGNSLLVTSMKHGTLYRLPLNADGKMVQGDFTQHFYTPNRYRSVLLSKDGKTIYIITDNKGNVIGKQGGPINAMANPGALLKFEYTPNGK